MLKAVCYLAARLILLAVDAQGCPIGSSPVVQTPCAKGNHTTDATNTASARTPTTCQPVAHSTPHPKIIHCCILPKFDNFSLNPKSLHNKKGPPEGSPFHRGIRSQSVHHHQLGVDDLDS